MPRGEAGRWLQSHTDRCSQLTGGWLTRALGPGWPRCWQASGPGITFQQQDTIPAGRRAGRASGNRPLGVPSWSSARGGAGGWGRAVWGIPPVLSAPLLGPPCQLFQRQQRYVSLPRPNNANTSFRSQSFRGTSPRQEHIWSENVPGKQKPPSLPASQRKNWKGLFQMYVCWGIGEEAVYIC